MAPREARRGLKEGRAGKGGKVEGEIKSGKDGKESGTHLFRVKVHAVWLQASFESTSRPVM
jgi:hypothetical protein